MKQCNPDYVEAPAGAENDNTRSLAVPAPGRALVPRVRFDVTEAFVPGAAGPLLVPTEEVTAGKPHRDRWYRAHPDDAFVATLHFIHDRVTKELHLVTNAVASQLPDEVQRRAVYILIDLSGRLHVWPVVAPAFGAWIDAWSRTAHKIVPVLRESWARVVGGPNGFRLIPPESQLPDPSWPQDLDRDEVIGRAFAYTSIDSLDHPLVRRLIGRLK